MAQIEVQYNDTIYELPGYISRVQLWIHEPGTATEESGRLMNVIEPTSRFKSFDKFYDLNTIKGREAAARDLIEGWVLNGHKYDCKFRIVHC